MTTCDFLDALKARYKLPSDYALAHFMGIARSGISSYRSGKTRLDDSIAMKVAKLLDLDAGYVVACAHAERAKRDDVRDMWQKTANALKRSAGALLVCLLFYSAGGQNALASTAYAGETANFHYYVKLFFAWLRRWLRAIFTSMRLRPGLLAACLLVSACHNDRDDNHGFGFHFDEQAANGLRLRHQPDVIEPIRLATLVDIYDQTQACTGIAAPGPFVIVVAERVDAHGRPGGPSTGLIFYDPPLILIVQGFTWPPSVRHEFVHYLLDRIGTSRASQTAHDSPFFVDCVH